MIGWVAGIFVWAAKEDAKNEASNCETDCKDLEWSMDVWNCLYSGRQVDEHSAERHKDDKSGRHDGGVGFADMELRGGLLRLLSHDERG
jgi:hypothetical protein